MEKVKPFAGQMLQQKYFYLSQQAPSNLSLTSLLCFYFLYRVHIILSVVFYQGHCDILDKHHNGLFWADGSVKVKVLKCLLNTFQ